VDITPTVARVLAFSMPGVQGRVFEEALEGGPPVGEASSICLQRLLSNLLMVSLPRTERPATCAILNECVT
jgi:hypothetical protein